MRPIAVLAAAARPIAAALFAWGVPSIGAGGIYMLAFWLRSLARARAVARVNESPRPTGGGPVYAGRGSCCAANGSVSLPAERTAGSSRWLRVGAFAVLPVSGLFIGALPGRFERSLLLSAGGIRCATAGLAL
jgi:hypothetical protein